ncbi:MAG: DUF4136 domain-containing protein [Myxococcota bacterium]
MNLTKMPCVSTRSSHASYRGTLACIGAFLLTACGGASGGATFETLTNPDVAVAQARTVAFVPRAEVPGFERVALPPEFVEIAREVAVTTLERLGWTITTPDEADVIIQGAVGRRQDIRPIVGAPPAHFDFTTEVTNHEVAFTEATLVLDAFVRADSAHLWHAHALGTVRDEPSPERFANAVERLLVNFPRAAAPAPAALAPAATPAPAAPEAETTTAPAANAAP